MHDDEARGQDVPHAPEPAGKAPDVRNLEGHAGGIRNHPIIRNLEGHLGRLFGKLRRGRVK